MKKEIEDIKKFIGVKTDIQMANLMGITISRMTNIKAGRVKCDIKFCIMLLADCMKYIDQNDRKKLCQTIFDQWSEQMKKSLGL